MKITGTSMNKVISIYEVNKKQIQKNDTVSKKDTIEISQVGKSLSTLAGDEFSPTSNEKIQKIITQLSTGTYKVDNKALAKKMLGKQ